MITVAQLGRIMPYLREPKRTQCLPHLNAAMREFSINTPKRQAAFLAQIAHESGELRYNEELASGAAYDTGRLAKRLGNTPESDGDGQKWKGHGWIQITGYDNHKSVALHFNIAMDKIVEWLKSYEGSARSAAWYWHERRLNELADLNTDDSFLQITKAINGGYNGLDDRLAYWRRAKTALRADDFVANLT